MKRTFSQTIYSSGLKFLQVIYESLGLYGPKFENGKWRIWYNMGLKDQHRSPDIVAEIKIPRLEWLGHVIRMENDGLPSLILNSKPEVRRNVCWQKMRWFDDVETDLRALGVKRWSIKALGRTEWSAILRDAKAKPG